MNAETPAHVRQRPAGSVGRSRDAGRDQLILDAVLDLLSEQGPGGLTMEAVAARAGVGKSTVYRRWSHMNDLLADVVDTITFPTGPRTPTGSLRDDLVEGLIGASGCMDARRQQVISALLNSGRHDAELVDALRGRFIEAIARAIAMAVTAADLVDAGDVVASRTTAGGELPWPFTEMDLATVIGLLTSLPHVTGRPLSRGDFDRIVDDVLLPLLGSRAPQE
ncbi:TetR/AcrR family transcriptional regulator [Aeromicrobium alkaliterrae]